MESKKVFIIANWKMNPASPEEARRLFEAVKKGCRAAKNIETIVCPPSVYCSMFAVRKADGNVAGLVKLGGQNCFWEKEGAYTGEVSASMLKNLGCQYVLVGHSERRRYFKEDDGGINKKIKAALRARLRPILCVGEEARDSFDASGRIVNEMSLIVSEQLKNDLAGIPGSRLKEILIAYEPIWAIGTGQPCSALDAMKARLFIRKTISNLYDRLVAEKVVILYGGSVNSKNAGEYIEEAGMDGLLIGGTSLNASEFISIINLCGK